MKSRLTAWLSLLLVCSAVFGAPVARIYTNRASCYYVYSEQRPRRAEQIAEAVVRPWPDAPPFLSPAPVQPTAGTILDFSLFQRPPPTLSL
jgi:hypothetical protein